MRIRNFIFVAVVALLFASCNGNNKSAEKDDNSVQSETGKSQIQKSNNSKVIYLTNETFKQKVFNYESNEEWKYEGTVPCIVDFYADWCGPCKRIAPTLEELAKEYDGEVIIYKVDTDKQQAVAQAFGIKSIPSILFVPVKGDPQMAQGALPKESFVSAINEVLLNQKEDGESKS